MLEMPILKVKRRASLRRTISIALFASCMTLGIAAPLHADETCMSPYMPKIVGQEDYVYVWTLGTEGVGDEQDKLVTIDVNPASDNYGAVIDSVSVGGRNEAHHSGFTDDRRYLWAASLDTNKIFICCINPLTISPKPLVALSARIQLTHCLGA